MCLRYALSSPSLLCGAYHYTKYVDHVHKHFKWPCTINENGRYNTPNIPEEGYMYGHALSSPIFMLTASVLISIEMKPESIAEFEFPIGRTVSRKTKIKIDLEIFG